MHENGPGPGREASFWTPAAEPSPQRLRGVGYGLAGGYLATYTYLGAIWYSDTELGSFHFFNDWHEWQQLDKVGHTYGAYQEARVMLGLFNWAGMRPGKARLLAGAGSFVMQSTVELFDGFAEKWGASWHDLAFNAGGSLLAVGNDALFGEQRFILKWSFGSTDLAAENPELLGSGLEQWLKDYNGQTYWLSTGIQPWLPAGRARELVPAWLGVAFGYGGNGMTGGYGELPREVINQREYREFYVGLDIHLRHIETGKPWLNTLLWALDAVRLPLPALRFSRRGTTPQLFGGY